jgi:hypothetical protein
VLQKKRGVEITVHGLRQGYDIIDEGDSSPLWRSDSGRLFSLEMEAYIDDEARKEIRERRLRVGGTM